MELGDVGKVLNEYLSVFTMGKDVEEGEFKDGLYGAGHHLGER